MKQLLEKYLTKIPMYTLIGGALGALVLASLILSSLGILAFSPFALMASLAVFTGFGVLINLGLGKLYGVKPHIPSSAITGLILTLLFTPSLVPETLLQYGFIALIAQASKYVITYKRRHIFNPVAIAALVGGGVLQLQYASWWVATPVLLIPILITAFLMLYKTRNLALGGIFIGTAVILVTLTGILRGEPINDTLMAAIASWPIIFLAGFMLTEPLTLPPKRRQKYIIGFIAAIVVALPFHVGNFYSSPELALVVINLLAFALAFKQRKGLTLTYLTRKALTPTSYEFTFKATHPVHFEPGQYIELTLPHSKQDIRGVRRTFSVTSTPNTNEVTLGVKFYEPSSTFKKALLDLSEGDTVQTTGISGDFTLPKSNDEKLLFIAGGIGITPFVSQIRSLKNNNRTITLLYFARSPEEMAYKKLLDVSCVTVHYFVADQPVGDFKEAPYLSTDIIKTYVPDITERQVYISGPPIMVTNGKKLLRGEASKVHSDYFSGY